MNNLNKTSKKEIMLKLLSPLILMFAPIKSVYRLFGTNKRQITASILCSAMILTILPIMSLMAFAANSTPLTFTAEEDGSSVTLNYETGLDVMYKLGNGDWSAYTKSDAIQLDKNNTVSFKGTGITTNFSNHFSMTGKLAAFGDVTSLTNGVGEDATLSNSCYYYMFYGCTSLTAAPQLPTTTLASDCYMYMFQNCTSLTAAPQLPATTLASYCYFGMFKGCTSLTTPPQLPATTLSNLCYYSMFCGCTSLKISTTKTGYYTKEWLIPTTEASGTTANSWNTDMLIGTGGTFTGNPALNATYYIYEGPTPLTFTAEEDGSSVTLNYVSGSNVMYKLENETWTSYIMGTPITLAKANDTVSFKGTNVLTNTGNHFTMTGKLAASGDVTGLTNGIGGDITLSAYCYQYMFAGCTSLTAAPQLPATTLTDSCYSYMFQGCTSLETAPQLPTTTLADHCYNYMFADCTSLKISATKVGYYNKEWSIPTTGTATTASGWNASMLSRTGGTFTTNPEVNTVYYIYVDRTPPVISGIENGKSYCEKAEFTVTDENPDTVKVNGNIVTASNNKYTLTSNGTNVIVATDKMGNEATTTVTVYSEHAWDEGKMTTEPTTINKGVKTYNCAVCGETKTEEIPMLSQSIIEEENVSDTEDDSTTKPNDTQSPQTGDISNIALWLALMLVSGGVLTILGITKKRKRTTHNNL